MSAGATRSGGRRHPSLRLPLLILLLLAAVAGLLAPPAGAHLAVIAAPSAAGAIRAPGPIAQSTADASAARPEDARPIEARTVDASRVAAVRPAAPADAAVVVIAGALRRPPAVDLPAARSPRAPPVSLG